MRAETELDSERSGNVSIMDAVRRSLSSFGVDLVVQGDPGEGASDRAIKVSIELIAKQSSAQYAAVVMPRLTLTTFARIRPDGPRPVLAISDYISARTADALREAGVQYADAAGNTSIRFDGVMIEVQGRRRLAEWGTSPRRHSADATTSHGGNMFSTRRSQVIMALLAWPELWNARVLDVVRASGASAGQVHDTLRLLERAGFSPEESVDPRRQDSLLEFWTSAYTVGLGPKLALASYRGDINVPVKGASPKQAFYLSGESAHGLDLVRAATLTVYVDEPDPRLALVNKWRRDPEEAPNVFVRQKFWKSPRDADEHPRPGGHNSPWPMVYADLLATNDPRLAEVARTWRSQHA